MHDIKFLCGRKLKLICNYMYMKFDIPNEILDFGKKCWKVKIVAYQDDDDHKDTYEPIRSIRSKIFKTEDEAKEYEKIYIAKRIEKKLLIKKFSRYQEAIDIIMKKEEIAEKHELDEYVKADKQKIIKESFVKNKKGNYKIKKEVTLSGVFDLFQFFCQGEFLDYEFNVYIEEVTINKI